MIAVILVAGLLGMGALARNLADTPSLPFALSAVGLLTLVAALVQWHIEITRARLGIHRHVIPAPPEGDTSPEARVIEAEVQAIRREDAKRHDH